MGAKLIGHRWLPIIGSALLMLAFPLLAAAEIVTFNMVDVADTTETLEQVTVTSGAVIPGGVDLSGGDPNTVSYLGFDIDGDMPNPLPEDDNVENYYDVRVRTGVQSWGSQIVFDGLDHYPVGAFTGSYVVSQGTPFYLNRPFASGELIGDGVAEYVRSSPTWSLAIDESGTATTYVPGDNFLGFKLDTGYYGWIRVQYDGSLPGTLTLLDGAYENTGAAIAAGDDGSAVIVEGDYNGNGVVDAADYTIWRDNLGLAGGATPSDGDGTGDGDVTPADYDYWKSKFPGSGEGATAVSSAPEPTTFVLGIGCLAALLLSRRCLALRR